MKKLTLVLFSLLVGAQSFAQEGANTASSKPTPPTNSQIIYDKVTGAYHSVENAIANTINGIDRTKINTFVDGHKYQILGVAGVAVLFYFASKCPKIRAIFGYKTKCKKQCDFDEEEEEFSV